MRTPQQLQEIERMANCLFSIWSSFTGNICEECEGCCVGSHDIDEYLSGLNSEFENELKFMWDGSKIFVIQL